MNNYPYNFKTISGIDTLYFFYVTNEHYDNFFIDLAMQLNDQADYFRDAKIAFQQSDLKVRIGESTFEHLGESQGFLWFKDMNDLLRIGLKDSMTNEGLNDIQVQFTANGIYTIGLKGLLRFTDDLLKDYVTGVKPITRCDLNIFVQHDLGHIRKEMFVTRKRLFISHFKEVETKHALQTLYVGKKPFLLRLYDKREELKKSKKQQLMKEYLASHDIEINEPLFNIEFEMHREYLKSFDIDTVDKLLERAELLFKDNMDAIRMIDLNSITDNTANGNNRYRAQTHPLWQYIKDSYTLKEFLQIDLPLERIKRKTYVYSFEEAITDHMILAQKCMSNKIPISLDFYQEVLDQIAYAKKPVNDFAIFKHTMDDEVIYKDVSKLSNFDLKAYVRQLEFDMNDPHKDLDQTMKHFGIALEELDRRGFPKAFPF
jgi:hypothetical protein